MSYQNHTLGMVKESHTLSQITVAFHLTQNQDINLTFFPCTVKHQASPQATMTHWFPDSSPHWENSTQTLVQVTIYAYYHKPPYSQEDTE